MYSSMAHYRFADNVCFRCFQNDSSDESLVRIYCKNYVQHTGVPPIPVTWSGRTWALVPIRPLPDPYLLDGNYVRCNGNPAQCRGERCTFAHSDEELAVWNTLLDEKRQQRFTRPRMHVNASRVSRLLSFITQLHTCFFFEYRMKLASGVVPDHVLQSRKAE